ncbi:BamA/TamA family outer membrane protein [Proteiniphilum sp. UBA5384]|uniref:translocation and assembly module lipoprotein TamL n=1 Tax=Proteiniphilum sp. UBA5384 TaxID=1947279 RepID=UPI0025F71F63|nr:BamA/TamA family outer membrane protein [Proteiniphilum sp. UBA5384]
MKRYIVLILSICTFSACSVTKKVPEGSYLLNKTDIKSDVKGIVPSTLKPYLRQKPNSSMILLGRVKLQMYNIPNNDSTWLNRQFLKYGEPPVLYNDQLTVISAEQIRLHMKNKGYLNAVVDTTVIKKDKKANVTYDVTGNEPHRIRVFKDTIHSVDTTIYNILKQSRRLELMKEGDIFDLSILEEGRERVTTMLRNRGYYNFQKDNFYFIADTTVGTNEVDVTLAMNNPTDSTLHRRHYIGDVTVISGVNPAHLQDSTGHAPLDTVEYKGIKIISEKNRFLRPRAVYYNTFLRPGRIYSDRISERTYASLNGMGAVNQTQVNLTPVIRNDTAFLDSRITLFPGNLHYSQFGVDGTNSQGDLGVAGNITYEHRNLLKGGEIFRIQLKAAYEFITASDSLNLVDNSYYEYGGEASLTIPQLMLPWLLKLLGDQPSASTEFSVGLNYQNRPDYLRQFFSLGTKFQWASSEWQLQHSMEPLGVTYVSMPRKSDLFEELYLSDENSILRFSFDDLLIVRSGYNITYSNYGRNFRRRMPAIPFRIRSGVEWSGWLPRILTNLGEGSVNEDGFRTLFGLPYSEYVRGDFDISASHAFDDQNTLAGHFAVGVAYPFGNSTVLPFERRYFGGGANSVRGWSTRTLGPGTYNRDSLVSDFGRKVGDIKLDMSLEYRHKLTKMFELATFVDAGNIWTIKDYSVQPGGKFGWNTFYKELAVAYGLGLRLDLNFLLIRVDGGMKAHNPGLPEGSRWTIFKPNFKRDFAFHFAIGYPF